MFEPELPVALLGTNTAHVPPVEGLKHTDSQKHKNTKKLQETSSDQRKVKDTGTQAGNLQKHLLTGQSEIKRSTTRGEVMSKRQHTENNVLVPRSKA